MKTTTKLKFPKEAQGLDAVSTYTRAFPSTVSSQDFILCAHLAVIQQSDLPTLEKFVRKLSLTVDSKSVRHGSFPTGQDAAVEFLCKSREAVLNATFLNHGKLSSITLEFNGSPAKARLYASYATPDFPDVMLDGCEVDNNRSWKGKEVAALIALFLKELLVESLKGLDVPYLNFEQPMCTPTATAPGIDFACNTHGCTVWYWSQDTMTELAAHGVEEPGV